MRALIVLSVLVLAGCTIPKDAVISEINDSSVKIQAPTTVAQVLFDAKAREGCAMFNKAPSAPLSERLIETELYYAREVLYACQ